MDITGIMSLRTRKPKEKTKRKGKSETSITTTAIIEYIDNTGFGWANKFKTMGVFRNGVWTNSNMKLGTSDVIACVNGKYLGIEIKTKKDYEKDKQIECRRKIKEIAKGEVFVVKDFEDFKEQFTNWINKQKL